MARVKKKSKADKNLKRRTEKHETLMGQNSVPGWWKGGCAAPGSRNGRK
jgi:hypothetical protein